MRTNASISHLKRMLKHLDAQERIAMGLKHTVETIGELRSALSGIPDEVPFQIICDCGDYRKFEVQSHYDREPERFVKFEPIDQ
jgi:hypothetical protein